MSMDPDNNRPYFFKIIFDGLTNEHLKIPPMFVKHISKEISDMVILKRPSGSRWYVKLSKKGSGVYLEDGWKQFMSDNSLGDNEFLLFGYNGNTSFNVQIFDKNGTERVIASDTDSDQDSAFTDNNLKQGKPGKNPAQTHHAKAHKNGSDTSNDSFISDYPHFKACLKNSSVGTGFILPVPMAFARAYLPQSSTNITIQNSQGKAWEVACLYNGTRCCFSGGWRSFIRGNKLKKGDICIFELIDKYQMQVNIFRSG